jgi:hypothetical protein
MADTSAFQRSERVKVLPLPFPRELNGDFSLFSSPFKYCDLRLYLNRLCFALLLAKGLGDWYMNRASWSV